MNRGRIRRERDAAHAPVGRSYVEVERGDGSPSQEIDKHAVFVLSCERGASEGNDLVTLAKPCLVRLAPGIDNAHERAVPVEPVAETEIAERYGGIPHISGVRIVEGEEVLAQCPKALLVAQGMTDGFLGFAGLRTKVQTTERRIIVDLLQVGFYPLELVHRALAAHPFAQSKATNAAAHCECGGRDVDESYDSPIHQIKLLCKLANDGHTGAAGELQSQLRACD